MDQLKLVKELSIAKRGGNSISKKGNVGLKNWYVFGNETGLVTELNP